MNRSELQSRATHVLPGGVNSPVRAFRAVGGDAPFIASAKGAILTDTEGKEYIDFIGSWGPMILGHSDPLVVRAVQETAGLGLSFGASTEREVVLAETLTRLYPSIEMLRCVSSGTEATMSALRLARGFTGRPLIVKFDGNYHGHSDCLLVKAGSGAATFGSPDSAGVPSDIAKNTLSAVYNDLPALRSIFEKHRDQIAAVILEPVAGNMGCVPPAPGFLAGVIELCTEFGALSIFDEVMTGCRLSINGAQGLYGLSPDLTCLGKIVGGGLPLAVYGGRRDVMEHIAPLGAVYQAGTLSGNPLSVAAALATLQQLDSALYEQLEAHGAYLEEGLNAAIKETGARACVQRVGSMITVFFHEGPVQNWDDAKTANTEHFGLFHQGLQREGVYWPPAQFEAAFLSRAHTREHLDRTIQAAKSSLNSLLAATK